MYAARHIQDKGMIRRHKMPEGFFIGQFEIRFYGIILMLGAVAGAFLATRVKQNAAVTRQRSSGI
jgi:prolipoprotein diacylglyceryltransferase